MILYRNEPAGCEKIHRKQPAKTDRNADNARSRYISAVWSQSEKWQPLSGCHFYDLV